MTTLHSSSIIITSSLLLFCSGLVVVVVVVVLRCILFFFFFFLRFVINGAQRRPIRHLDALGNVDFLEQADLGVIDLHPKDKVRRGNVAKHVLGMHQLALGLVPGLHEAVGFVAAHVVHRWHLDDDWDRVVVVFGLFGIGGGCFRIVAIAAIATVAAAGKESSLGQ